MNWQGRCRSSYQKQCRPHLLAFPPSRFSLFSTAPNWQQNIDLGRRFKNPCHIFLTSPPSRLCNSSWFHQADVPMEADGVLGGTYEEDSLELLLINKALRRESSATSRVQYGPDGETEICSLISVPPPTMCAGRMWMYLGWRMLEAVWIQFYWNILLKNNPPCDPSFRCPFLWTPSILSPLNRPASGPPALAVWLSVCWQDFHLTAGRKCLKSKRDANLYTNQSLFSSFKATFSFLTNCLAVTEQLHSATSASFCHHPSQPHLTSITIFPSPIWNSNNCSSIFYKW